MNIIAFDASTALLNVAISKNTSVVEIIKDVGLTHAESLLPAIRVLLEDIDLEKSNVELIVCSKGPGSFTGLRIGMATAKGLSAGIGCPYVSVPTLDILAFGMDHFPGAVIPVIDAKKKRVYSAVYRSGKRVSEYLDIEPSPLIDELKRFDSILLTGPDAEILLDEVNRLHGDSAHRFILDPNRKNGRGRALIDLGMSMYRSGDLDDEDSSPLYIRKSEAELALGQRD